MTDEKKKLRFKYLVTVTVVDPADPVERGVLYRSSIRTSFYKSFLDWIRRTMAIGQSVIVGADECFRVDVAEVPDNIEEV